MKFKDIVLLLLFLYVWSCGDEGVVTQQVLEIVSPSDAVVTAPPPEVWEILKYIREERVRWYQRALTSSAIWQDDLDAAVIRAEQIKAAQEAFYTKYIDAGGIAIIADAGVADTYLLEARWVVLAMTLKFPVLRERMLSRHGRDCLILHASLGIPEGHKGGHSLGCCNTSIYWKLESVTGYCHAQLKWNPQPLRIFMHEFAHALESEIDLLQPGLVDRAWLEEGVHLPLHEALKSNPGFRDRLQHAYNTAYAQGTWQGEYANVNYAEYWAEGVTMWFYDIGPGRRFASYAAFSERDPLLAALLSEWFPAVAFSR